MKTDLYRGPILRCIITDFESLAVLVPFSTFSGSKGEQQQRHRKMFQTLRCHLCAGALRLHAAAAALEDDLGPAARMRSGLAQAEAELARLEGLLAAERRVTARYARSGAARQRSRVSFLAQGFFSMPCAAAEQHLSTLHASCCLWW
jgi:hypothetical protein